MKIMVCRNHDVVTSARFMTEALKRLGHDVRHVGNRVGNTFADREVPARYIWEPDATYADAHWDDWTPDLIIYMDTAFHPFRSKYDPAQVPHIIYCTCNPVCNLEPRHEHMQHFFVVADKGLEPGPPVAWPVRGEKMTLLPCAYDPTVHVPGDIAWADREYDVCMVGALYSTRLALCDRLRAAGLKVFCDKGLVYDDYVKVHHNSRMALIETPYGTVGMRTFEAPAMGCLPLSQWLGDYDTLKPKGFLMFESHEQAVRLAQWALRHPDRSQQFVNEAMAWVKPHTWDNRAAKIVRWHDETYN